MNRASGNLWDATCAETVASDRPEGDLSVDLVIIGGGFTGCAAALAAAQAGARVCLLEANTIGHGGSGRNVGLVNAGLWLPPDDILAALGTEEGERLLAHLGDAPSRVFDLIARHGIACEATRAGTLHCAHSASGLEDLRNRFRQQNRLGAPVRLLDAGDTAARTGSPVFHGALFDPRAGTIQPLAYVRGLARAAAAAGARIVENAPVRRMQHTGSAWVVDAPFGTVTAPRLLLATNAYHAGRETGVERPGGHVPVHYFQVATAPLSDADRAGILAGGEGCWDTALVMSSFRLDRAGRLIVGGIGNLDGPGGRIHAGWARRKIRDLFPNLHVPAIDHSWCGRIAMTGDHIPKIRRIGPDGYACFGYSGRGIGPGTVFGTLAAKALLEGEEGILPLTPVEHHDEPFAGLREAYYETGALAAHLVAARR
jgi:glycine/D-amino acid oxidase-like deaminating enzyme